MKKFFVALLAFFAFLFAGSVLPVSSPLTAEVAYAQNESGYQGWWYNAGIEGYGRTKNHAKTIAMNNARSVCPPGTITITSVSLNHTGVVSNIITYFGTAFTNRGAGYWQELPNRFDQKRYVAFAACSGNN